MKTTQEYFKLTVDELLESNEYGYTKEENLLFDSGEKVTFFDSEEEMQHEKEDFEKWIKLNGFEIKDIVKTVNERIAVILV